MWLSPEMSPYRMRCSSASDPSRNGGYHGAGSRSLALLELLDELGDDLEHVADDAEIRHLKDRRVGVGVDGHDRLRSLHAGQVLDRARDAAREGEVGLHGLAGLTDLDRRGHP